MVILVLRVLLHQHRLLLASTVLARFWSLFDGDLVHVPIRLLLLLASALGWFLVILLLVILLVVILSSCELGRLLNFWFGLAEISLAPITK